MFLECLQGFRKEKSHIEFSSAEKTIVCNLKISGEKHNSICICSFSSSAQWTCSWAPWPCWRSLACLEGGGGFPHLVLNKLQMMLCYSPEIFKLHTNVFSAGEDSDKSSPFWTLEGILKPKIIINGINCLKGADLFVIFLLFCAHATHHSIVLQTVVFTLCRNILSKCWILFSFCVTLS